MEALKAKVNDANFRAGLLRGGKATAQTRGQAVGDLLISFTMPFVRLIQQAADRVRQSEDNVSVAFALAWYRSVQGRYPKTLAELAPKFLPKAPRDLFSGKPLIYRPDAKGYLLYSVGVNRKDEGGRSVDDLPAGDDLPVRMPLPVRQRKETERAQNRQRLEVQRSVD